MGQSLLCGLLLSLEAVDFRVVDLIDWRVFALTPDDDDDAPALDLLLSFADWLLHSMLL